MMNETVLPEVEWMLGKVPKLCQAPDCTAQVQTWCPLCEHYFCDEHDQLTPRRRHACLGEPADDE